MFSAAVVSINAVSLICSAYLIVYCVSILWFEDSIVVVMDIVIEFCSLCRMMVII